MFKMVARLNPLIDVSVFILCRHFEHVDVIYICSLSPRFCQMFDILGMCPGLNPPMSGVKFQYVRG